MQTESKLPPGEMLRHAMRQWVTGVAIVTSAVGSSSHGMTVNSFGSISLAPPLVTVTMANDTRTFQLVQESGVFAVTILSDLQRPLAELFAGRIDTGADRMTGLELFTLVSGAPFIQGGLAFIDCRVATRHPLSHSTLLIGEVLAAQTVESDRPPLIYFNRTFNHLA